MKLLKQISDLIFDKERAARRNALPTRSKQRHAILKTLLTRTGQEVSLLDIFRKSRAFQYNSRISDIRIAIHKAMGEPITVDVVKDIITNNLYHFDEGGETVIHSTYTLNEAFKSHAIGVLRSYEEEVINE